MGKIISVILLVFILSSCAVLKKDKTTTSKLVEKTEIKSDSVSKETINKEIDDVVVIGVQKSNTGDQEFDRRVNEAVSNVLRSINFQKSSGENSYKIYYDEKLDQIRAEIKLGETRDKEVKVDNSIIKEKTFEQSVEEYTKKITGSWITWLLVIFIFRKFLFGIAVALYPPLRGIRTVKDLLTPPNQKN